MTDAKRGAMLLLLGLFTAVLLYPALHDGGHILVTLLLGGRIRRPRLEPPPASFAADCAMGSWRAVGLAGRAAAGAGDAASTKLFLAVVCGAVGEGISVLGNTGLSLISLIGCKYGVIVENDDIMNAVRLWPEGRGVVLFCCKAGLLPPGSICAARPVQRVGEYFGIAKK